MKRGLLIALAVLVGVLAVVAIALLAPWPDPPLESSPAPAADYAAAMQRIEAQQLSDAAPNLIPEAKSIALVHGSRTSTAVVIYHGYTNVPWQFRRVAQAYYEAGYNVWVPRMPYHGEKDRLTREISKLTAEDLRAYADSGVDVGAGLGEHVVVVGLSGGGTLAEWAGTRRTEVAQVVSIAPLFRPTPFPQWTIGPLVRAMRVAPDFFVWWDPREGAALERPRYAYPQLSLKSLSAFLEFSRLLQADARSGDHDLRGLPVVVVSNANDIAVDAALGHRVTEELAGEGVANVQFFEIAKADKLKHDLADPEGENKPVLALAFRRLSEAIGVTVTVGPDSLGTAP